MKRTKLLAAAALAFWCAFLQAQGFPSKPVRLFVGFPPGGPADISARAIADSLGAVLGQPVVVDNRPGAGSVRAVQALLSAPADGHTLMLASDVVGTGIWLYKGVNFHPLKDIRAVGGVSRSPNLVVVSLSFPGKSINDLIRMAKEQPGKVTFASAGAGTIPHLAAELFKQVTGTQMTHVPYKGSADALPAVMSGQVDVLFDILFSASSLVKSGKLKALGVTSLARADAFPDVPTLDEQGVKGFEAYSTFGVVARPETPDAIVKQLNDAINKVLQMASVRTRLATLGATALPGPPQVFQKVLQYDYEDWGKVIRSLGMKPE